jgi:hypothetical protein
MIVAVSDRMVTAGDDIEFEQPQPKVFEIGTTAAALIYGDIPIQSAVAFTVNRLLHLRPLADMNGIAKLYAEEYGKLFHEHAEAALLRPLGLSRGDLLSPAAGIAPYVADRLVRQMQTYELDSGGGAILIGANQQGGVHMYQIEDPGVATCADSIGYAIGGIGSWHAESQFTFARYTKQWPLAEALFLAYKAKRRAEVAPGVGKETDVILITSTAPPARLHFVDVVTAQGRRPPSALMDGLKQIYRRFEREERAISNAANREAGRHVKRLFEAPAQKRAKLRLATGSTLPTSSAASNPSERGS